MMSPLSHLHNPLEGIFLSPYYDHLEVVDLRCKEHVKQATSGSLEDIRHVPEITPPLPPPTPYLKRS